MKEQFQIHVIRRAMAVVPERSPADAMRIDSDAQGRVLFREETVKGDLFDSSFGNCFAMAKKMIEKTSEIAKDFRVESITLKLGLDGTV